MAASSFVNAVAQLLLKNNGMIFGDFVVNSILHEVGKGEIPSRIDVWMHHSSKNEFMRECRFQSMKVVERDMQVDSGNLAVQRSLTVTLDPDYWRLLSAKYPIQLDVSAMEDQCRDIAPVEICMINTHEKNAEPFFKTLDFECNSLFMTDTGMHVSSQVQYDEKDILGRHNAMIRVLDEVKQMRTKLMFSCHHSMQAKARALMEKGWTIYDETITSINDAAYSGVCLLCHDEVPALHFKLQCCNARYHADCLKKSIEHGYTEQCNMCRSPMLLDDIHYVMLNGDNMS